VSQLAKLAAGTTIEVDAEGGSMFPLIRNGDSVVVRPIDRKLRVGDVVLLVLDGRWILHRIVELTAVTVRTQGDNQAQADPPVGLAAVQGIASKVVGKKVPLEWSPMPLTFWRSIGPFRRKATKAALMFRWRFR
jgi:signal peptidase I